MIVKTSKGYQVFSKDGSKALSKSTLTKEQAEKRLRQIEYFKSQEKK